MTGRPTLLLLISVLAACQPNPILDNPVATLPDSGAAVPPIFVWPLSGSKAATGADWIAGAFTPRWKVSEHRYDFHQALDLVPRVKDGNGVEQAMSQADIAAKPPVVHAVADGVIDGLYAVGSSQFPNSGNVVSIKHRISGLSNDPANVYYTVYLHLKDWCDSKSTCMVKDKPVVQGQEIGHLGNTATLGSNLDFWHLHFEVRGHPYQFYAKNPLRYLPHKNNNGYQPTIVLSNALPAGCQSPFNPQSPKFWVRYRADRDEIEINQVIAIVTNLADQSSTAQFAILDLERRVGITQYQDSNADSLIKESGEYDQDFRFDNIRPIIDDCSALRNEFHTDSSQYTMEVQFTGMAGATNIRIEAQVCDIFGHCESATPVVYP